MSNQWETKRIIDLLGTESLFTDGDWIESKDQDQNGSVRLIQLADIQDGHFDQRSARFMTYKRSEELRTTKLQSGDLLIARMPDPIGRSCIFPGTYQECVTVVDVAVIRTNQCDQKWLMYLLNSIEIRRQIESKATGTTRTRISRRSLGNIKLKVPPLPEQRKISEILSTIDKVVEINHQKIKKLKYIKKAMLGELLTKGMDSADFKDSKLGMIPKNWEVVSLKDVCEVKGRIGYRGYTVKDLVKAGEGSLTLGAKHIRNNMLFLENPEFISWEKFYESPEIMVTEGDIIFVQRGSIGKVALIKSLEQKATINPSLVLLKNITIENSFLFYVLSSEVVQKIVKKVMSSTAIPMLSQQQIKNFSIPFPPIKDQQNIAEILLGVDKTIEEIQSKISQIDLLKKSLMQDLLTGKVRVQVN